VVVSKKAKAAKLSRNRITVELLCERVRTVVNCRRLKGSEH